MRYSTRLRARRKTVRSIGALAALAIGGITAFGAADVASAAEPSQFTLTAATSRPATGTPRPASGVEASLWSARSVATTVVDGSGRVQVGAIGEFCQEWPRIRVTVDNTVAGTTRVVDPKRYGTYPLPKQFAAGRHTVTVQLVNDFNDATCDRNVHLASVTMEKPGTVPASAPPVTEAAPATTTTAAATPTATPARTSTAPTSTAPRATTTPKATTTTTTRAPASTTASTPASTTEAPAAAQESAKAPASAALAVKPSRTPPASAPGPGNTGVPAGTVLKRHDGDLTVTVDGTVVDGLDIHGFLNIKASNVTVRNTLIRGREPGTTLKALVAAYGDHRNFTIEDSTLRSDVITPYMDGLKGRNFTARRLDVSNVVDTALVFGDNVVIQDSWFHDTKHFTPWAAQPDNQTHNDNLEIVGGNNILVQRNTFQGASNAAIMITQDYSRSSNIRIEDNFLTEGDCIVNLSEKGKGAITSSMRGNRFGPSGITNCAVIAKDTSRPAMTDNLWAGTTLPVEIRSRPT